MGAAYASAAACAPPDVARTPLAGAQGCAAAARAAAAVTQNGRPVSLSSPAARFALPTPYLLPEEVRPLPYGQWADAVAVLLDEAGGCGSGASSCC